MAGTYTWIGATNDPSLASNWSFTAGVDNSQHKPLDGDTAIIPGGTTVPPLLSDSLLVANTLDVVGNGIVQFSNDTTSAFNAGLDFASVLNAAGTATVLVTGPFNNQGTIAANGSSGSTAVIDIMSNSIPQGIGTLALPGYFINYNLIEVDAGNAMTIMIGPNAELFNVSEILVNGGSLFINADSSAIAGGYAPAAGAAVIGGGGTLETNSAYSAAVTGVAPSYAFIDATPGNTLKIDNIGSFGGQILGFGAGDTIDLGTGLNIGKVAYSSTTGVLNLEDAGGTILASLYMSSGAFQNGTFTVAGGKAGSFNIGTSGTDTVLTTAVLNDTYNNTNGTWQTGGNWSNGVPGTLDTALIGIGAGSAFTLTTGSTAVSVGALTIGNDSATLQITSNTTVEPYTLHQFGGTLEVTSGNTLTTSALRMFGGSTLIDPTGELKLTGRPTTSGVGANNGTITISNGNTIGLRVSNGTLTVNGGTIDASPSAGGGGGNLYIGVDGGGMPAAVTVKNSGTNAGVVTGTNTQLSSDPTSFGMLTLDGNVTWTDMIDPHDTVATTGRMIVGTNNESSNSGTITPAPFVNVATLLVKNGAILTDQTGAQIGATTNSAGAATIETGAIWNVGSGGLAVGLNGTGSLSILSAGTVSTSNGGGVSVGSSLATTDGTVTVSDSGSLLKTSGGMSVGKFGHGVLNILNGGTVDVTASGMTVAASAGAVGTISISGTDSGSGAHALLNFEGGAGGLTVGGAGPGTLAVGGGGTISMNGTGGINVGQSVGAVGTASVSGVGALINFGTTAGGGLTVGQGGTGALSVSNGGTIALSGTSGISVGQSAGAVGLLSVSGPGALINLGTTAGGMTIGQGGTGTLQVLNGGQVTIAAKNLAIGAAFGTVTPAIGSGTVTVDGKGSSIVTQGTGTVVGNITVGSPGSGVLTVSNGGSVGASGGVIIAAGTTSANGLVTVNGGTLTATTNISVGGNGSGTLVVTGGGLVTTAGTNGISIGFNAGSKGSVIINSGTVTDAGNLTVGGTNAMGTLQVNGGGTLISGAQFAQATINATGTGSAAATITGGTWTSKGNLFVGDTGKGSLDISSGGLVNTGTNFITIGNQTGGNGTVTVSAGGTLAGNSVSVGNGFNGAGVGTLTVGPGGFVQVNSLNEGANSTINVNSGTITTGFATIGQFGTGATMTIGVLGAVNVTGNSLNIGSGGTAAASGSVTVNIGGTLNSSGTFGIQIGGGFTGSSGTLTVNGGQVNNTGFFSIGQAGSGSLIVQNGGSVFTNSGTNFVAMSVAGPNGALLSINSGQVSLVGGSINLGGTNASGSLSVGSGGKFVTNGTGFAQINATGSIGTAAATIDGGIWTSSGAINVGDNGRGSLDIANNGVVNVGTNSVNIGNQSAGDGTVSVHNGGTLTAGSVNVSDGFSGKSNAQLDVSSSGVIQVTNFGQTGGTVSVVFGTITSSGFMNLGGPNASSIMTIGSLGVVRETGAGAGINIGSGNAAHGSVTVNGGGTLAAAGNLALGNGVSGSNGVLTVNGGLVTAGNGIFVGGSGTGTITINGGGTVSNSGTSGIVIGASQGSGVITVNSGMLSDSGTGLSIGDQFNSTGVLTIGSSGSVGVTSLLVGTGGVIHMAGGNLSAGGVSQLNGAIDGFGTLSTGLNNASTLVASGGRLAVTGGISGTGVVNIAGGATLEVGGIIGVGQSVGFVSALTAEALQLDTLSSTIQNFALTNWQNGDELIIATGVTITGATWLGGSGTLEVTTSGLTYDFTNVSLGAGTTPIFTFGSNFVELVSCFAKGTRISTERGEVAVEDLCEGDHVQVVLGGPAEPVVWIGHRTVDCRQHPEPHKVWPVRIAAGAFGVGRPSRELWLSPDHAVYIGDVLIPVKYLINGTSIAQVMVDEVTYYHVELPSHSVLLAEGLAAESYLDVVGGRSNFMNGDAAIALYPDFSSRAWDAEACAPLVVTGPELAAAQRWVNGLAGRVVPVATAA